MEVVCYGDWEGYRFASSQPVTDREISSMVICAPSAYVSPRIRGKFAVLLVLIWITCLGDLLDTNVDLQLYHVITHIGSVTSIVVLV